MKLKLRYVVLILALLSFFMLLCNQVFTYRPICKCCTGKPKTIYVPGNYSNLQQALKAACPENTIIFRGKYLGHLIIRKKITIIGNKRAVIDGEDYGIVIKVLADGVTLRNLEIVNGGYGLGDSNLEIMANNASIINCTFENGRVKVAFDGDNNSLRNCRFFGRGNHKDFGVVVSGKDNKIINNTFYRLSGIILDSYFKNTTGNEVAFNKIENCRVGISLFNRAHDNYVFCNFVHNSSVCSIMITREFGPLAYHNYIYLNSFESWQNSLVIGNNNYWNSSFVTYYYNGRKFRGYLGNYWSNYHGVDENGDGVGDLSYHIYINTTDKYPLVSEFWKYKIKQQYIH